MYLGGVSVEIVLPASLKAKDTSSGLLMASALAKAFVNPAKRLFNMSTLPAENLVGSFLSSLKSLAISVNILEPDLPSLKSLYCSSKL